MFSVNKSTFFKFYLGLHGDDSKACWQSSVHFAHCPMRHNRLTANNIDLVFSTTTGTLTPMGRKKPTSQAISACCLTPPICTNMYFGQSKRLRCVTNKTRLLLVPCSWSIRLNQFFWEQNAFLWLKVSPSQPFSYLGLRASMGIVLTQLPFIMADSLVEKTTITTAKLYESDSP